MIWNVAFHSILSDFFLQLAVRAAIHLWARTAWPTSSSLSRCREERRAELRSSALSDRSLRKSATDRPNNGCLLFTLPLSLPRGPENGVGAHFHLPIAAGFILFIPILSSGAASVFLASLQFSFLILMDARASLLKKGGVEQPCMPAGVSAVK